MGHMRFGQAALELHRPARAHDTSSTRRRNTSKQARPSFVRSPEGNGCAERFIRSLKERLLWARTFSTVEELRGLLEWAHRYNERWLLERHHFLSPSQARRELLPSKHAA
ncbi:integrase core domain-containing protein [Myxococcus sp. K15C18031901]|nr:integrase core domain-containing protein [Myxococcus dinghuensis]MCP3100171.1 integrase core domain-containing protein [Myxococcus dinghuensis]